MASQKWGYLKKKCGLRAMLHSAESTFSTVCGRISPRIRKYFRALTSGLGAVDLRKKNRGRKSRETVSLRNQLCKVELNDWRS
jgi:hypothetical protein